MLSLILSVLTRLFRSGKNHENSMEFMELFFSEAVRTLAEIRPIDN